MRFSVLNILVIFQLISSQTTISTIDTTVFSEGISMVVGKDGLPFMCYHDRYTSSFKMVKCGDINCSQAGLITSQDGSFYTRLNIGYTSIVIGPDSNPSVTFMGDGELVYIKCRNNFCGFPRQTKIIDTIGSYSDYPSMAIGSDGLPVISYFESTNLDLLVLKCGNWTCDSGNVISQVDTAGYVGEFTSITIGVDGYPIISYFSEETQYFKIVKCGDIYCGNGNIITPIARVGSQTLRNIISSSIKIGSDSNPVASYFHNGFGTRLRVIKCSNASCSGPNTIITIDSSSGITGEHNSLEIGSDGFPIIGYKDYRTPLMWTTKVAKCNNNDCSSFSTVVIDTTAGDFPSIAIGLDGYPLIGYSSHSNETMKYAKCSNLNCTDGQLGVNNYNNRNNFILRNYKGNLFEYLGKYHDINGKQIKTIDLKVYNK